MPLTENSGLFRWADPLLRRVLPVTHMFRFSPFDANPSFSPFILCLYVSFPNSLHSAQRFFSPSSHIVRVNLVFQFSPLYIFIFFPHSCVTKYYVFSRYFSSLHAINFELILFVFFSLIHSTLLRILALSHTPPLSSPHEPSPLPLQCVFSPFPFLYSTCSAANSSFTQSHHSLHLLLPFYSDTPLHLVPPLSTISTALRSQFP